MEEVPKLSPEEILDAQLKEAIRQQVQSIVQVSPEPSAQTVPGREISPKYEEGTN